MILVTGGAGFIGSNLVYDLRKAGHSVIVCDIASYGSKNLARIRHNIDGFVEPHQLPAFLQANGDILTSIIHMGAISSTTEHDRKKLMVNNTMMTVNLWMWCAAHRVRFIYASSASVYGSDSTFWDTDNPVHMREFQPLNDYGWSKLSADIAIASMAETDIAKPPQWVGLRFFNVYGPNESHKGDQASIITKHMGKDSISLFDIKATRDFVYVKDCTKYILRFLDNQHVSGLFNIGTEQARDFVEIAGIMGLKINKIPMPDALKSQYQFHTKSVMNKAKFQGLWFPPTPLEEGIKDYIESYQSSGLYR